MTTPPAQHMRLYNRRNERLYLNDSELQRFIAAAHQAPADQRSFALTLAYTGVRLSEARYLQAEAIQLSERVLSVHTLKRRGQHVVREIPIPVGLADEFSDLPADPGELLWRDGFGRPIPRITAYRWIKDLMIEAEITGPRACPKGLRHAFGVRAVLAGVPLHMLQIWMGHASMKTTAIYTTVMGNEQLILSDRMW